ncbi:RNA-binding protein, YhbY family [Fusobacterium gonidiaformans 3-1-5R]|uniref:RNA-binding protein, YhbY family n=2 Tax=Fusobacterium TaxID=848 RepID=E5BI64_9FUSO|nr:MULTISPECIES: ribosome assembly RNA-binding protein YhbY [Fusobacterium]AVQ16515.1 ribosome assembly RNA-binding protein YhbY [Fusobacterium gonidiaformans ATCC 25563]EFS22187.1 RNA-binding protein, YhbY family [Fusobacterium gonidiaformans 3-1-5R]EFS29223.1 YhbY family putative RNA-binding protein [Fusobacterium gonidiaformans ATCC 25563]KXA15774.1 RNA-binding protein, YhbY family [Fusobacterium equinum]
MKLTSKQRAFLKKKAHELNPIVRIGKDGLQETVIESILSAIDSRELIKVKILQNCETEKEEIYQQLLEETRFDVVGMIGRTIIVFKENKEKPVVSTELKSL